MTSVLIRMKSILLAVATACWSAIAAAESVIRPAQTITFGDSLSGIFHSLSTDSGDILFTSFHENGHEQPYRYLLSRFSRDGRKIWTLSEPNIDAAIVTFAPLGDGTYVGITARGSVFDDPPSFVAFRFGSDGKLLWQHVVDRYGSGEALVLLSDGRLLIGGHTSDAFMTGKRETVFLAFARDGTSSVLSRETWRPLIKYPPLTHAEVHALWNEGPKRFCALMAVSDADNVVHKLWRYCFDIETKRSTTRSLGVPTGVTTRYLKATKSGRIWLARRLKSGAFDLLTVPPREHRWRRARPSAPFPPLLAVFVQDEDILLAFNRRKTPDDEQLIDFVAVNANGRTRSIAAIAASPADYMIEFRADARQLYVSWTRTGAPRSMPPRLDIYNLE